MITIKSKHQNKSYIDFLIQRFEHGLSMCYAYRDGKSPSDVCTTCKYKTACFDIQSALHHLRSISLRMETKSEELGDS